MRMVGADGVAAITIILYGQFLFNALYLGFPWVWHRLSASSTEQRTVKN